VRVNSLIEFIDAAVDTKYVQGPFEESGGIFLVGYPGSFKTTILRHAVDHHHDALIVSDMNVQQWIKIRGDFITGRYSTIAFTDFEKIYQRHQSTASHIEGIIKGLVAEGYGTPPSGDQRMPVAEARALVIGAMTSSCMERRYDKWEDDGFTRRFLWLVVSVKNINEISAAIRRWEKIDFGKLVLKPANKQIALKLSDEREEQLQAMMKEQPGFNGTGYTLLKKITAVLEWKYTDNGRVKSILDDIAPSLSKKGGKIVL
jgi:hypothetical protein